VEKKPMSFKELSSDGGKMSRLRRFAKWFCNDAEGAVTADFVVLSAGIIGLGLAVTVAVASGTQTESSKIARCMKITGNLTANDNLSLATQMSRASKRCGRL